MDQSEGGDALSSAGNGVEIQRDGEAQVPRISEFPAQLDSRQRELIERIEAGPRRRARGPTALWLYSPDMADHAQALGEFLRYNSAFAPQLSELVILIIARHFDCDFEWSVHAPIAARSGIPASVIKAIGEGSTPAFADADQANVFAFVKELLENNRVSDAAFGALKARFGERGVVELTGLMGYYSLVAFLLNATRLPPLPDASLPRRRAR